MAKLVAPNKEEFVVLLGMVALAKMPGLDKILVGSSYRIIENHDTFNHT